MKSLRFASLHTLQVHSLYNFRPLGRSQPYHWPMKLRRVISWNDIPEIHSKTNLSTKGKKGCIGMDNMERIFYPAFARWQISYSATFISTQKLVMGFFSSNRQRFGLKYEKTMFCMFLFYTIFQILKRRIRKEEWTFLVRYF